MSRDALSTREKRFVEHYFEHGNGTQAMREISSKQLAKGSACTMAARMMKRPRIRAYIEARQAEIVQKTDLTEEWVILRLMKEANGDPYDTTSSARVRALELLARKLDLFPEQNINLTLVSDSEFLTRMTRARERVAQTRH